MDSGRYRNQRFKTCHKKKGYADFCLEHPEYYMRSLRMRMFYEYCVGLKELEKNPRPEPVDAKAKAGKGAKAASPGTKPAKKAAAKPKAAAKANMKYAMKRKASEMWGE